MPVILSSIFILIVPVYLTYLQFHHTNKVVYEGEWLAKGCVASDGQNLVS